MSEATVIDPPDAFASTAVPLLKEYTAKLKDWFQQLEAALPVVRTVTELAGLHPTRISRAKIAQAKIDSLVEVWNRFRPPAYDFARQVSGMVERVLRIASGFSADKAAYAGARGGREHPFVPGPFPA